MRTCAIMQATYLPWTGFFALMASSDDFIILDDVQFSYQSWQQRNRIRAGKSEIMLTVPVHRPSGLHTLLKQVTLDNTRTWRKKHSQSIRLNYCKSQHWENFGPALLKLFENQEAHLLLNWNLSFIEFIKKALNINTNIHLASDINEPSDKVERLIQLCQSCQADRYISPIGSFEYINLDNRFTDSNIDLRYIDYTPQSYTQVGEGFLPSLSTVDLLLNMGPESVQIIKTGINGFLTHEELTIQKNISSLPL